ncbi:hypothetical protein PAESOLCIP111_02896 [Paenibacillus solanacearum]|uniref:N-acetyltransferase domain-containing protein n=1 Tax=Paenibacillus solanacearum TaxID=2048548 RepID=A0A916NQL9_9BACL|nr:GNAT family N-acetyltransferase [Paenibacillus solanacearum]CAG7627252.1 hypothetical protein PAESOLCIP111_02896 [Paenibacillus solanacearum]
MMYNKREANKPSTAHGGMMMIREAEAKDAAAIERLYRLLLPDDKRIHVLGQRLEEIRREPYHYCFVYEDEGRVAGTVLLHLCLDPMYGKRPFALIENVVVDPDIRGKGVGNRLFAHVEQCCRERDCTEILLLSSAYRTEAHRFFERQGFRGTERKGFVKRL